MANHSCVIFCKVTPKASKSEVLGWDGTYLKIRLAAIPEKGKANEELIRVIATALGIAKSRVELVSGETSRLKKIKVDGMLASECLDRLM
ncbi:MAG: DUF167 domain-containing protein [Chlamydiales bacterium]|nr:DUF167 domain-containing protein [Chlamydiales bacterium]